MIQLPPEQSPHLFSPKQMSSTALFNIFVCIYKVAAASFIGEVFAYLLIRTNLLINIVCIDIMIIK